MYLHISTDKVYYSVESRLLCCLLPQCIPRSPKIPISLTPITIQFKIIFGATKFHKKIIEL